MNNAARPFRLDDLRRTLADLDPELGAPEQLTVLIRAGLDRVTQPVSGATLLRSQALAAVAATDLSLAKLYEGHTDALAIFAELGVETVRAPEYRADVASWGVWAAEAPQGRSVIETVPDAVDGIVARTRLSGGAVSLPGKSP